MAIDTTIVATFDEEGAGSVSIEIRGLDSESLTPNTFSWTLSDTSGNVINSREDVVQTPTAKNWIDLSGDDLAVSDHSDTQRIITAKGTMNTTRDGESLTNVPFTVEKYIDIETRVNIP